MSLHPLARRTDMARNFNRVRGRCSAPREEAGDNDE